MSNEKSNKNEPVPANPSTGPVYRPNRDIKGPENTITTADIGPREDNPGGIAIPDKDVLA